MPSISVIVPVYKVEPFLKRCLNSILNQSFQDFELILVDDGSPDSCGAICDAYASRDARIHVIHQQNGGLSAARNSGIDWAFANSDSQWLAFVDSDDWVHKDFLLHLYRTVQETGCLLSACGFYRTGGEEHCGEEPFACINTTANGYYCSTEIHDGVTAVAWNKLYHKSLFAHLRYPVGKLHEDEFTTYQAVYAAGAIGVTFGRLYAYYQNPEGIMRSSWNPRRMHVLEAVEQQILFAQRTGNERFLRKAVEQYIYTSYDQLKKANETPRCGAYRKELRRKLRRGLKQGSTLEISYLQWDTAPWIYEEAYPIKPFWWIVDKMRSKG